MAIVVFRLRLVSWGGGGSGGDGENDEEEKEGKPLLAHKYWEIDQALC